MSRVATVVPDESDLLCEGCGYTLNGLPTGNCCPECGKPIQQSVGEHRGLSEFEKQPTFASFVNTTLAVVLKPTQFYRTLITRDTNRSAATFSKIHRVIGSALFFAAAGGHFRWILETTPFPSWFPPRLALPAFALLGLPALVLIVFAVTRLATWLSAIEARYWGMRLPYLVVHRGLEFHAAHYLPVGFLAATATWGYQLLLETRLLTHRYDDIYLYTLCGLVILSAIYLFQTYWISMRAMMYANR